MIRRTLQKEIEGKLFSGKAIVLLGARKTGKTTLIMEIVRDRDDYEYLNCDEAVVREQLENASISDLQRIIGKKKIIIVDEAQRLQNSGLTLKLITDNFNEVQLIVSGSSSLELSSNINEPLTGRKWEYQIFPLSWGEMVEHFGYMKTKSQLEQRILYGMYPDVVKHTDKPEDVLLQLSDSYLYKDLLSYQGIRKPRVLDKLLQALALQIGQEVSFNELSNILQIDKNTVQNYIDLLQKTFVVFQFPAFSRNMRKEISRGKKIYFYDNGIRNAIISNFHPLELRNDKGALWENFLISERMKLLSYINLRTRMYFWRTTDQREIDYVEERAGQLSAFEFKWNERAKVKIPRSFEKKYQTKVNVIHQNNFPDFLDEGVF